jgi:bifunctional UDP-N-acetylglucosamine pyrophosphorylase/glucosamine-1-phosphate N-acetyltransferase
MTSLPQPSRRWLAVVLAAGEGTRMASSRPKVLHEVAGLSLIGHVLASASRAGADGVAVVVGPGREDVASEVRRRRADARVFVQEKRLGTAHAVLAARDAIADGFDDVVVLFGDTPLVRAETIGDLRVPVAEGAAVAVLGFEAEDPAGYGRLLVHDGELTAIREHKDASPEERSVRLCNAGLMAFDGRRILGLLEAVGNANAAGEYYLTDAVEVARSRGMQARARTVAEEEVQGVNDRVQLAAAEAIAQRRLRKAAMLAGATMIAPETVFLSYDTVIGRDVLIEPHVVISPGSVLEDGCVVHAFTHIEGGRVGPGALVGPLARLRPGAVLATRSKIGNFVEIKNSTVGEGAKVNHFTYLGDTIVGAGANVGAGTITCNYDGFGKARTEIGAGAFIGSNSSLVAPVKIGDGAYVGAGSVITQDVPPDSLAVARARQFVREGWAKSFRESKAAARAKKE